MNDEQAVDAAAPFDVSALGFLRRGLARNTVSLQGCGVSLAAAVLAVAAHPEHGAGMVHAEYQIFSRLQVLVEAQRTMIGLLEAEGS